MIRIVLADDHAIFRDGLRLLLQLQPDMKIVAEAESLTDLKRVVAETLPHLLLLDYHMPGGDASSVLLYCKQRFPDLKVIVLTGARSPLILKQLSASKADGILLKEGCAAELIGCVRDVLNGKRVIAEAVRQLIAQSDLTLTRREFQILKLVHDGLANSEIAERLCISPKTVDKHRENMMRKLDVNNLSQLIRKVHSLRLLDAEELQLADADTE